MTATAPNLLVTLPTDMCEDFFRRETRSRLDAIGQVTWNESDEQFSQSELRERIDDVDIVVTGWGTPILDESIMDGAETLDLIAHTGGSVAYLLSDAVFDRDLTVCSANRPMARYVAELTLGHMIAAERGLTTMTESMRGGEYERVRSPRSLIGASIGLVGLGTIGRYLIRLLAAFDVTVRLYDPYVAPADVTEYEFVEKATLSTVFAESDIVSVHASKTPETVGLIGPDELRALPDGALLVNTARAALVDRDALYEEVTAGRIRAALDVYHTEPLPADDPLRSCEHVQLTPHAGGHGPHERFGEVIVAEIERFVAGDALQHEIPPEQARRMTR